MTTVVCHLRNYTQVRDISEMMLNEMTGNDTKMTQSHEQVRDLAT